MRTATARVRAGALMDRQKRDSAFFSGRVIFQATRPTRSIYNGTRRKSVKKREEEKKCSAAVIVAAAAGDRLVNTGSRERKRVSVAG